MNIHSGTLLISTPLLDGTDFEKAIIFIAEHNEKGALGFVVNHPFSRTLNELVEFNYARPFALFNGGPVEKEALFFLHRRRDVIEEGTYVKGNVYMGGNFKKAVACINNNSIAVNDIKLFIGYCGWDAGELEAEIEEGSWLIVDAGIEIVFSYNTEKMWENLITNNP